VRAELRIRLAPRLGHEAIPLPCRSPVAEPLPPGIVPWRPRVIRALEKNIVMKRGGEWRIVQHQQTLVAPES
jgi:hypothetical protein